MILDGVQALWQGLTRSGTPDEAARSVEFEGLYLNHREQVRRTAYRLSGAEDLDDLVQETFVRIWRAWGGFRREADVRTWIYRVTVNTVREHWRKRGRYHAATARYLDEPRSTAGAPEQDAWLRRREVADALRELSLEHREAVTLCYLEDLSLAEAAQVAQVPEGTLKSRLFYARRVLGERLNVKESSHGQ